MTRIMQLSDIAVEGVRLPGVDMVNGCEATRRIDNHLRDYCLGMGNSSSNRHVSAISETRNGYWRVEYKVMELTRVTADTYALFYLSDGSFYQGPEMGHIDDVFMPQPPPKPWYLSTGKADLEWENQP